MEQVNSIDELPRDSTIATAIRFSMYTFSILLMAGVLPWVAQYKGAAAFKENGAVEWLQLGFLVAVSLMFLRAAAVTRQYRQVFVLLACFSAFAAIREMDATLNNLIPLLGWKIGYVFILYAGFVGWTHSRLLRYQITECIHSHAFALLWAGFIIAIPFAQLVGNSAFLQEIMDEDYNRDYRRIIEEIGEIMGYGLLFIGSFELILQKTRTTVGQNNFEARSTYDQS